VNILEKMWISDPFGLKFSNLCDFQFCFHL
jgi:hypothetical protein